MAAQGNLIDRVERGIRAYQFAMEFCFLMIVAGCVGMVDPGDATRKDALVLLVSGVAGAFGWIAVLYVAILTLEVIV